MGETDVVALRGTATFRLRITSLSSHRDKRRFRIQATRARPRARTAATWRSRPHRSQVAPQDYELDRSEPLLTCVTDPMKSVTKLGRYGRASSSAAAPDAPLPVASGANGVDSLKRK